MSITLNSLVYDFDGYDRNGVAVYTDRSGGVPTSFSVLTFQAEQKQDYTRLTIRLSVPVVSTESSACSCPGSVLRTSRMSVVFDIPNSGTAVERTDLEQRIEDLVGSAQFSAFLINLVKPST